MQSDFHGMERRQSAASPWIFLHVLLTMFVSQAFLCDAAIAQGSIRRPLVFIPGIFGSKLCEDGDPSRLLWGSAEALRRFTKLQINPDGVTAEVRATPCGEVDQFVYFGPLGQDIYGHLTGALARMGYRRNENLFVFSYDWRLSNLENAGKLAAELERYAALAQVHFANFDGTFDFLAHSMGGIIATVFANTGDRRAARLITVSTPFQGSVKLMSSLEGGWGWVQRQLVSMADVRRTILSFPSIYELLPIYSQCCALGKPGDRIVLDLTQVDHLRKIKWFSEVSEGELARKLDGVKKLRAALKVEAKIRAARMYGVQQDTPEQVYLSGDPRANPDQLITKTNSSWLGDGTVMDYSAMIEDDLWRLPGTTSHENIMSDGRVIEQIQGALLNNRRPRQQITAEPLAVCETTDGIKIEIDGATLEGQDRIFSPGEAASLTLWVRSSKVANDPAQLGRLTFRSAMVAKAETKSIDFGRASEPEPDTERTPSGGVNAFHKMSFRATFDAPDAIGDAKIELGCGVPNPAISVWNFTVAQ